MSSMPTITASSSFPPMRCVKLPDAIDLISRREKVILDMARAEGFTSAKMRDALKRAGEIH